VLHLKDLWGWGTSERLKVGTSGIPLPMFLKRYDSKRVRGWGSVNDMTGKDLGGSWGRRAEGKSGEGKSGREFDALYTKQL
jgi:hypothetical protein